MPGRRFSEENQYRYGFNGKENENDVKGEGNQQDYGMRIYDPRVGKFLSVDPLTKDYSHYTPYSYAGNKPIKFIDLDGLEESKSLFEYDFRDLMNVFNSKQTGYKATMKGEGPIGGFMKKTNETINPLYLGYKYGWEVWNGKDFETNTPKSRVDAASEAGIETIFILAGGKILMVRSTYTLEMQMLKNQTAMGQGSKSTIQKEAQRATSNSVNGTVELPNPFPRFTRFETKYKEHSTTFGTSGNLSKTAYYDRAIKLADSEIGGDILGFTSQGNTTFKLNKKTGEFIVINPDGKISSFYRRVADPIKYLNYQKEKYGIKTN